jgi:hypothetical protein
MRLHLDDHALADDLPADIQAILDDTDAADRAAEALVSKRTDR